MHAKLRYGLEHFLDALYTDLGFAVQESRSRDDAWLMVKTMGAA